MAVVGHGSSLAIGIGHGCPIAFGIVGEGSCYPQRISYGDQVAFGIIAISG